MTRDEILTMPAGADMNFLVAEKVMGWKVHRRNTAWFVAAEDENAVAPPIKTVVWNWRPSEDIKAAWEVVDVLRRAHCCVEIKSDWHYRWDVALTKDDAQHQPYVRVSEESLPLVICRAALLSTLDPS